jgi:hypothetical protein
VSPNDAADAAMVVLFGPQNNSNTIYQITDLVPLLMLILPSCSRRHGTESTLLGYYDHKDDVVERGLPDWLVRNSAAFGVDERALSYTDDFEN